MDLKIKIILGLLLALIGIISYSALENYQSLSSSITDIVSVVNTVRSSIQTDLTLASIGFPTEPISKLQNFTLDDINQYRQANNIQPLSMMNEDPSAAYAKILLNKRCLQHIQDNGTTPQGRFHNDGINSFSIGENLVGGQKAVFDNLENFIKNQNYNMMFNDADSSWGHRKNILDPSYTAISVGIAYDATNMIIVEDFLSPLKPDEYIPSSDYSGISDSKKCW